MALDDRRVRLNDNLYELDDIVRNKRMDGFVSYEENFEEDAMFNRQPVEVNKKRR